jgi:tellurite methyltransferase
MSSSKQKWDAHYRQAGATCDDDSAGPLDALRDFAWLLPVRGKALDLACGRAANAEFLARRGLHVHAWDISSVVIEALEKRLQKSGLPIDAQVRDVVALPPQSNQYDVIVVSRFLDRCLSDDLVAALKPNGMLVYQTFVVDKVAEIGPGNSDYLLHRGELLELFSALAPRVYFDLGSSGDAGQGLRNESLLIAQKVARKSAVTTS